MSTWPQYRLEGTVTAVKAPCALGHKVGDKFTISWTAANGLCGSFYHDIFAKVGVLQFGGRFPWQTDDHALLVECPDRACAVQMELRRYPQ